MFEIETARLRLLPLTHAHLLLISQDFFTLDSVLGIGHAPFELNAPVEFMKEFFDAIKNYTTPAVEANPDQYMWFTHWLIINTADNLIVGGIGATGLPDQQGETTIGYFINARSEGKGFATEAVKGLLDFVFRHPGMRRVIAFTEEIQNASGKVLLNNGFMPAGQVDGGHKWSKSR
jgi:[ribosomal protein S5]-alanine N-acetyltransferase